MTHIDALLELAEDLGYVAESDEENKGFYIKPKITLYLTNQEYVNWIKNGTPSDES